jgi:glutaredoxin
VKEFLSRAGLPFTAKHVDDDEAAYDELLARGFRSVPITVIGAATVVGYDPAALQEALAALPRSE